MDQGWIGDVAEAWHFNHALPDAEWDGVIAYLMSKYGIAV